MDKDVKDLLDWLEDKEGDVANIWGMQDTITNPDTNTDEDTPVSTKDSLKKIFTEEQLRFIKILVNNVVNAIEFHNTESLAESHLDIRETIDKIDAKLRNHRHELDKNFSAKPEF